MILWIILIILLLIAIVCLLFPIYKDGNTPLWLLTGIPFILTSGVIGLYLYLGSPEIEQLEISSESIDKLTQELELRLESEPNDIEGWKILGRTYLQLQRVNEAIVALEKAVELELSLNSDTLSDLAEALVIQNTPTAVLRSQLLFKQTLKLDQSNSKSLFYLGMMAAQSGNNLEAIDFWERLIANNPPKEIKEILVDQINILKGSSSNTVDTVHDSSKGLLIKIELDENLSFDLDPNLSVFIFARNSDVSGPPIAVVRKLLSDLPLEFLLTDADLMLPGNSLFNFEALEITARISLNGNAIEGKGDLFGNRVMRNFDEPINIIINQVVE